MAKKWAKDKATELLSADSGRSDAAGERADETEREAKSNVGEQLLRTAFPKLGEMADAKEEREQKAESDAERERNEEVLSLPTAQVQLTASGWMTGQWSGQMHYGWNEISGDGLDKLLWFELFAAQGEEPVLDGHRVTHWSFQLYGWHGDGTYDLVDLLRQREATGWSTDFLEWAADFADAEDMVVLLPLRLRAVVGDGERRRQALLGEHQHERRVRRPPPGRRDHPLVAVPRA